MPRSPVVKGFKSTNVTRMLIITAMCLHVQSKHVNTQQVLKVLTDIQVDMCLRVAHLVFTQAGPLR